ncbi:glutathione synthase [Sarracenia purpurea var. burkii]
MAEAAQRRPSSKQSALTMSTQSEVLTIAGDKNHINKEETRLKQGNSGSPLMVIYFRKNLFGEEEARLLWPIVVDSVKGSHMWDIDGIEYIDYVGSWGPAIIGVMQMMRSISSQSRKRRCHPRTPRFPGIPKAATFETLTSPYNNISTVKNLFDTNKGVIAAVVLEPVVGNSGFIAPKPSFLDDLHRFKGVQALNSGISLEVNCLELQLVQRAIFGCGKVWCNPNFKGFGGILESLFTFELCFNNGNQATFLEL